MRRVFWLGWAMVAACGSGKPQPIGGQDGGVADGPRTPDAPRADGAAGAPAMDAPPADAAAPSTVLESMVGGSWQLYFRARDTSCVDCRDVQRVEVSRGAVPGEFLLVGHLYRDVPGSIDPPDLADGAQICSAMVRLREMRVPGIDPLVRSVVGVTRLSGDCPAPMMRPDAILLLDQQAGGVVADYEGPDATPYTHSAGYPTTILSQGVSVPLVRCADRDRVPGRDYCMPACDFPGADPGRTACGFPPYVDPGYLDTTCASTPWPSTAPPTLRLSVDVSAFGQSGPVTGAKDELHAVSDDRLLVTATSDAAGHFEVEVPTGGASLDFYHHLSAPTYVDTYMFHPFPFGADTTIGAGMLPVAFRDQINAMLGITADPTRGAVAVNVQDCSGQPVSGATITIPGATVIYADANGMFDPRLTETTRAGGAAAANVAPGPLEVTIRRGATTFRPRTIVVHPGALTNSFRRP